MDDEVDFVIRADVAQADLPMVRRWTDDTYRILADVEKEVLHTSRAVAHWVWVGEVRIPLQASPNGISRDALKEIARVSRDGLQAGTALTATQWPTSFPHAARERARKIGRDIKRIDTPTTVSVTDEPDVVLDPDESGARHAFRAHRVFSTVEGAIKSFNDRGGWTEARLIEIFTGRVVWLRLTDAQGDKVAPLYKRRVIVEGFVAYDPGGHPVSITGITRLEPRTPHGLVESIGVSPNLSGGLPAEDFISRMKGHA